MSLVNINGSLLTELAIPVIDNDNDKNKPRFLYPEINREGKLLAVIFYDGSHDYRAMFDLQNMEFAGIEKIRL